MQVAKTTRLRRKTENQREQNRTAKFTNVPKSLYSNQVTREESTLERVKRTQNSEFKRE